MSKTVINYQKNEELSNLKVDKPIVAFPDFYSTFVNFHPYKDPSKVIKIWPNIIPMGAAVQSPNYYKQLAKFNLSSDLIFEILRGNAYLGITKNNKIIEYIEQYAIEHYGQKIVWDKPIYNDDEGRIILKIYK